MIRETDVKNLVEVILNRNQLSTSPYPVKGKNKDEQIDNLTAAIWIAHRMQNSDEAFEQAIIQYMHLNS
ncbi:MAG: hypothetical protein NW226_00100 [Microscillaceae bacterium]|nr:hypothetical protein [Microscillaceae bacterium]